MGLVVLVFGVAAGLLLYVAGLGLVHRFGGGRRG